MPHMSILYVFSCQLYCRDQQALIHCDVQGAQLVKDMHVEGLSLYWRTTDSSASSRAGIDTVGAWLDTTDAAASLNQQEVPLEGAILPCLDCSLRLTMTPGRFSDWECETHAHGTIKRRLSICCLSC